MGSLIAYNSEEACILYIKKRNYIYLAIEGFLNSEKTKAFYKSMVAICLEKHITRILFDASKLDRIKEDDLQWMFKDAAQTMYSLDLKKIAFLSPENSFGHRAISKFFSGLKDIETKILETMEDAETWLFENVNS